MDNRNVDEHPDGGDPQPDREQAPITQGVAPEECESGRVRSRLQLFADSSFEAIFLLQGGVCIDQNQTAEELLGYSREEAIGRHGSDWIASEDRELVISRMASGYENAYEVEALRKDGSTFPCEIQGKVVAHDGKTLCVTALRDISERKRLEKALDESERRFELAMRVVNDGLFDWNIKTDTIYFSPVWKGLLGYEDHEIPNAFAEWERLTRPEDVRKSWAILNEVIAGERDRFEIEFQMRHKKGHYVDILSRGNVIFDANGEPERLLGTHVDISERKRVEKELREAEWKFQALFDNSPIGVAYHRILYDSAGKAMDYLFIDANQKYVELTGVDPRGCRVTEAFPGIENDSFDWIGTFARVAREGGTVRFQQHLQANDRWYDCVAYQYKADHFVVAFLEITEQKKAEIRLEESERQFRTLFEKSSDAIFVVDRESGRHLQVNEAAARLVGRPVEEICRLHIQDIAGGVSEKRVAALSVLDQVVEFGKVEIKRPDGRVRLALLSSVPLDDRRAYCIARDITDIFELEEKLRQTQKVEAIGRLAGGVAHDLNNMLSPIIGYCELLLQGFPPEDERRTAVERILRAGISARDLVHQLLAFSRKQVLAFKPLDLNRVVEDIERLLQRTIPENIAVRTEICTQMLPILADRSQLDQVVMNLAINAADAMPGGGSLVISTSSSVREVIRTGSAPELQEGEEGGMEHGEGVLLTLRDSGCGMDRETCAKIFEPFFTTKGKYGTGLGLSTTYGIVKQHGGHIWVESVPGRGTTFFIVFPRNSDLLPEEEERSFDLQDLSGSETILMVEDNEFVRGLNREVLEMQGYRVIEAQNGEEALAELQRSTAKVDLLLTDVVMPGMNGRQLSERLGEVQPGAKVLFMSGYTDDIISRHGVLEEGVNFLQKPFSLKDLSLAIRAALSD